MPERLRALHEAGFRRYMATGQTKIIGVPVRVAALRKDGCEIDVELTLSALPHEPARIVVASLRDLRDRVELERQILAQQRLAAQNAVMSVFAATDDAGAAAVAMLQAVCESLDWQVGNFWLLDAAGTFTCVGSWRAARIDRAAVDSLCNAVTFAKGEGLPGRVWDSATAEWISDLRTDASFRRSADAARAGLRGAFALPVLSRGRVIAVAEFFSERVQVVDDELLRTAATLGSQIGQFMERIEAMAKVQDAEGRAQFLADASAALAASLDYEVTFQGLAKLVVPRFADWCAVHVAEGDAIRQVAVEHFDRSKIALAIEIEKSHPLGREASSGPSSVIRTGRAELYATISDDTLRAATTGAEHFALVQRLGFRSALVVPLVARGHTLGALTLVWAESSRRYTAADLSLMEELGRRAGLALDNARLFADSLRAVRVREEFLSIASHELKTPLTSLQLQVGRLERAIGKEKQDDSLVERLAARVEPLVAQVTRLDRLVEDLLDVSRISSGQLTLVIEPVDLSAVVQEVAARFKDQAAAAGCTLTVKLESALVGQWDRMRLEQIVSNFLSNAVKYGAGAPIEVATTRAGATMRSCASPTTASASHRTTSSASLRAGAAPRRRNTTVGSGSVFGSFVSSSRRWAAWSTSPAARVAARPSPSRCRLPARRSRRRAEPWLLGVDRRRPSQSSTADPLRPMTPDFLVSETRPGTSRAPRSPARRRATGLDHASAPRFGFGTRRAWRRSRPLAGRIPCVPRASYSS